MDLISFENRDNNGRSYNLRLQDVTGIELGLRKQASPQYCLHTNISQGQTRAKNIEVIFQPEPILTKMRDLDQLVKTTHVLTRSSEDSPISLKRRQQILDFWITRSTEDNV